MTEMRNPSVPSAAKVMKTSSTPIARTSTVRVKILIETATTARTVKMKSDITNPWFLSTMLMSATYILVSGRGLATGAVTKRYDLLPYNETRPRYSAPKHPSRGRSRIPLLGSQACISLYANRSRRSYKTPRPTIVPLLQGRMSCWSRDPCS